MSLNLFIGVTHANYVTLTMKGEINLNIVIIMSLYSFIGVTHTLHDTDYGESTLHDIDYGESTLHDIDYGGRD